MFKLKIHHRESVYILKNAPIISIGPTMAARRGVDSSGHSVFIIARTWGPFETTRVVHARDRWFNQLLDIEQVMLEGGSTKQYAHPWPIIKWRWPWSITK